MPIIVQTRCHAAIVCATAILTGLPFITSAGYANAQSVGGSEPATKGNGPKTLQEWILGTSGSKKDKDQFGEEDRVDPDRPHFPEASTAVGKGRAVLETGYTFTKKEASFASHSYPEALLRVGMFTNWFEFRIGQNFINERRALTGGTTSASGAQDLYLGVKLALTEQKGVLPAIYGQLVRGHDEGQTPARR